jgi:hypothetical protein
VTVCSLHLPIEEVAHNVGVEQVKGRHLKKIQIPGLAYPSVRHEVFRKVCPVDDLE